MSKLSNCLILLNLLNSGRKYHISELSKKLEVSERMIRQYKDELEIAGIYIDTIKGRYGGYVLKQHFNIPKIFFSQEEIDLLDTIKDKSLQNIKNKAHLLDRSNCEDIINKSEENNYKLISKAINENKKINISYIGDDKTETIRDIIPNELIIFKDNWWVVAYCMLRNSIRNFELSRIKILKIF